jgi:hypothetical protein
MKMSNKKLPEVPKLEKPEPVFSSLPPEYEIIEISSVKSVRPWDLFNKNKDRVPEEVKDRRFEICKQCPFFINMTGTCKKCGCFMDAKTKLSDAACPVGKWNAVKIVYSEEKE